MTRSEQALDEGAAQLTALVAAAAPAVRARPDLAEAVLDRMRRDQRHRRRTAVAVGGALLALGATAASLPGWGSYRTVTQPSEAMAPTVRVGQEVVFGKELTPLRGDVVLVRLDHGETMSRVLAVGGDTIGCPASARGGCDEVVVNGKPLDEDYLRGRATAPFAMRTVPPGSLFLLGDNRDAANDSRYLGPVSRSALRGVAVRIYDEDGVARPVPGAPRRTLENGAVVDPADPVPPAETSEQ